MESNRVHTEQEENQVQKSIERVEQPQEKNREQPIKNDQISSHLQKPKVVNIGDYKTRQEKEKIIFSHIDEEVNKLRDGKNQQKVNTCCCCNKKPAPPAPYKEYDFKESSDPEYKMKKVVVVYNPFSGNGRGKKNFATIEKCLKQNNVEIVKIFKTERHLHAVELMENEPEVDEVDAVIITGGDGTLKEIINGLVRRCIKKGQQYPQKVGYVAGGTANDTAQTLYGIQDRFNVEKVMNRIINGKPYFLDIMKITFQNNQSKQQEVEYAHMCANWGLGVNANITADSLRCLGKLRYDVGILIQIMKGGIKDFYFKIDDKEQEYMIRTHLVLILNQQHLADKLRVSPFASCDDGLLDISLFENQGKCQTLGAFDELKRGGAHIYNENVIQGQVQKISVRTEPPTLFQLDGENDRYMETPLTVECLHKYFKFVF